MPQNITSYVDRTIFEDAAQSCQKCAEICFNTAMVHCLSEGGELVDPKHFRLLMNCSKICETSVSFQLSHSDYCQPLCKLCAEICLACARSCEKMDGMATCVASCRKCAASCRALAA